MNFNCENCGWSEIVGSSVNCNYSGFRTWRDACCEAWEPKEKETNMIEVVRCKDCRKNMMCEMTIHKPRDWFCADGERQ